MHHTKDQILIRAKDISLIVAILTLLGILVKYSKKPYDWDAAVTRVERLDAKVSVLDTNQAVISSQINALNENINKLNWRLDRMNRRSEQE